MYYMGFSIHQISICLKGILWTDFFYSVTPGNLKCRYIFHIIFSVTYFFCCVIYFIYMTGLCKVRKHPISEGTLNSSPFISLANWPQRQRGEIINVSCKRRIVMRNQPLINQLVLHRQTFSPILFDSVILISIDLGLKKCQGWQTIRNSKRELFPQLPCDSSRLTTNWRISGPRTGKSTQPKH